MPTSEKTATDFGVRMGNRTYPAFKKSKKNVLPPVLEFIDDNSPQKLRKQLASSIQELFPFLSLREAGSDKSALFAQYVDSLADLGRCRDESLQLTKAMVETTIDHGSKIIASADFHAEVLASLLKSGEVDISKPENYATAEMGALKPPEILVQLQSSFQKSIDKFVAELFEALDSLVDRSAAGLVHWTSSNTVKYHFFRRSVREKPTVTETKTHIEERSDFIDARITETRTSTPVTCNLAHHKHDLVNAIQTSLDNSKVTMPAFVQELVQAIPLWMRPFIHVVEGYLINEKIFECELFTKELVTVEYEEELIHGYDPAVCFGPYVLIGWGPREIGAEQQRKEKEVAQQTEQQNARFWGLSTVASQAFCVLFAHLDFILLAMILFVVSIACVAQWVGQASQEPLSGWKLQRIGLGFMAFLGGVQLLLTPLSFSLVLTGIGLLIVGGGVLSIDRGVLFRSFHSRG